MQRSIGFTEEHDLFRDSFRSFLEREASPHHDEWEREGVVDRDFFLAAGKSGFLGMDAPEAHGGGGADDFRFNQIVDEEVQ